MALVDRDKIKKDIEAWVRVNNLLSKINAQISDYNDDPIGTRETEIEIEWNAFQRPNRHWYGLSEGANLLAEELEEDLH